MRKSQLVCEVNSVASRRSETGRAPFAHAVKGEDCCFFKGTWKKGAGRMTFMVVQKNQRRSISRNSQANSLSQEQLVLEPQWHGPHKTQEPARSEGQVSLQQPFKLDEGLL